MLWFSRRRRRYDTSWTIFLELFFHQPTDTLARLLQCPRIMHAVAVLLTPNYQLGMWNLLYDRATMTHNKTGLRWATTKSYLGRHLMAAVCAIAPREKFFAFRGRFCDSRLLFRALNISTSTVRTPTLFIQNFHAERDDQQRFYFIFRSLTLQRTYALYDRISRVSPHEQNKFFDSPPPLALNEMVCMLYKM